MLGRQEERSGERVVVTKSFLFSVKNRAQGSTNYDHQGNDVRKCFSLKFKSQKLSLNPNTLKTMLKLSLINVFFEAVYYLIMFIIE